MDTYYFIYTIKTGNFYKDIRIAIVERWCTKSSTNKWPNDTKYVLVTRGKYTACEEGTWNIKRRDTTQGKSVEIKAQANKQKF